MSYKSGSELRLNENIKNYLLNGALDFWQRGSTVSTGSNDTYLADRIVVGGAGSSSAATHSRQTDSPILEGIYSLRTARTASGATNTVYQAQKILASTVNSLMGKYVTFSFYAKGTMTSSTAIQIAYHTPLSLTTDSWSARLNSDPLVTLKSGLTLTGSWVRHSVTFQITPAMQYGLALAVRTDIGVSVSGEYIQTTGWQLEEGLISSPFSRASNSYNEELMNCKAYYEKSYDLFVDPATSTGSGTRLLRGHSATFFNFCDLTFMVEKIKAPDLRIYSVTGGPDAVSANSNSTQVGVGVVASAGTTGAATGSATSGLVANEGGVPADC